MQSCRRDVVPASFITATGWWSAGQEFGCGIEEMVAAISSTDGCKETPDELIDFLLEALVGSHQGDDIVVLVVGHAAVEHR